MLKQIETYFSFLLCLIKKRNKQMILLQAMMFFPVFIILILVFVFFAVFLISKVVNAILEIIRKDHAIKLNSLRIATLVTAITLLGLIIWLKLSEGNWIN